MTKYYGINATVYVTYKSWFKSDVKINSYITIAGDRDTTPITIEQEAKKHIKKDVTNRYGTKNVLVIIETIRLIETMEDK